MNLNENIANAVVVLQKTYESVNKMLEQCRAISESYGYNLKSDKTLRWRSDANTYGWLLNSLILVFQKNSDPDCSSGNGWKDGPVYAVQVFLGSAEEPDLPAQLYVSRFDYADINDGWTDERLSPADQWAFYHPTHKDQPPAPAEIRCAFFCNSLFHTLFITFSKSCTAFEIVLKRILG